MYICMYIFFFNYHFLVKIRAGVNFFYGDTLCVCVCVCVRERERERERRCLSFFSPSMLGKWQSETGKKKMKSILLFLVAAEYFK